MKRLFKLIEYIYSVNKLYSLEYKIKKLQDKQKKIDSALRLGFAGERNFVETIKSYNDKLKAKDDKSKVNIDAKKRLQELAGIPQIDKEN